MKKVTFLSFLILSIALVGLLGNWHFSRLAQAHSLPGLQPSPTPEILPNGWHRYTDHAAGYAISYPPDVWFTISRDKPLEFPTVGLILPPSTGRGNQGMTIVVLSNPRRLPPTQFIAQDLQQVFRGYGRAKEPNNQSEIKLGKNDAFQIEVSPFLPGIYIFHQDKVYFLALHADMLSGLPPTSGAREMFFKIASTFTLVEDEGR